MKPFFALIGLLLATPLWAQLRLPGHFGDHMVLQRQKPVPVWGWARPGERLSVAFRGQLKTTRADREGRWRVTLDPTAAGGPFTLAVRSRTDTLMLRDVLVGEVWLCSGQSNMEWTVRQSANAAEEIRAANHPQIRHFGVKHTTAAAPQADVVGRWEVCSPETVGGFTAVGYFFARELTGKLGVPVGLMHTSWGGRTPKRG